MTTHEEKKRVILEAVNAGIVSARSIDVSGAGSNVLKIKRGGNPSPTTIDTLYNKLVEVADKRKLDELLEPEAYKRIRELEAENARLKQVIRDLTITDKNIHGWTLQQRGKWQYWYAVRKVKGKFCSIYIGKDKEKAEAKILECRSKYE